MSTPTRRIPKRGFPLLLLTTLITSPTGAQVLAPVAPTARTAPAIDAGTDSLQRRTATDATASLQLGRGAIGGLLGGGIGAIAGAAAGSVIMVASGCRGEYCGMGAVAGGLLGESAGLAVGSHIGSRGRAGMAVTTLVSAAIGVTGSVLAGASGAPVTLLLVPAIQLVAVLSLERER